MKRLIDRHYIGEYIDLGFAILLNLMIFSTNNKLMMYTKYISLLFVLLCLYSYISSNGGCKPIKINRFKSLYMLFCVLIFVDCIVGKNSEQIIDYSIYWILGIAIIFADFQKRFYYLFMKMFKLLFWIFIFSMMLEALLPSAFSLLFSFASFGDTEMRALTSGGAIAGLAFEKAYAAFLCNLGIGVVLAEFVVQKSLKSIVEFFLILVALMMTGKRTLFIIPLVIILVYIIIFSENNKIIKVAGTGLLLSLAVIIIYMLVPGAALIIDRLLDNGGDVLSGRENFWNYAMQMFHESPIWGTGFLSFNDYAYGQGFRYYGEKWNYQAHNVYIQLLGETGIIGFGIMVSLIIIILVQSISSAKTSKNFWNVLTVYWIILFTIYGVTGNTIYYPCQLVLLFVCIIFLSDAWKIIDVPYKSKKRIRIKIKI